MSANDAGPAFPARPSEKLQGGIEITTHQGMSLRDYFAAAALQGLLAAWPTVATDPFKFHVAASGAYRYADAMLAERAK